MEKTRYTDGILIPNFFLTYLLARKVESTEPIGKKHVVPLAERMLERNWNE